MALPPKKGVKPPVQPVQEDQEREDEWIDFSTSTAYLLRQGDEAVFEVIGEPRPVKNGGATVVDAFIYSLKQGGKEVVKEQHGVLMLQKVPSDAVSTAIARFGLGKFIMYLKNEGKENGKRWYRFTIKVKPKGDQ